MERRDESWIRAVPRPAHNVYGQLYQPEAGGRPGRDALPSRAGPGRMPPHSVTSAFRGDNVIVASCSNREV